LDCYYAGAGAEASLATLSLATLSSIKKSAMPHTIKNNIAPPKYLTPFDINGFFFNFVISKLGVGVGVDIGIGIGIGIGVKLDDDIIFIYLYINI
jgi:hypothetical protein